MHLVASGPKLREGVSFTLTPDGVTGRFELASGALSEAVQLAVECQRMLSAERPVQRQQRPVPPISA